MCQPLSSVIDKKTWTLMLPAAINNFKKEYCHVTWMNEWMKIFITRTNSELHTTIKSN